jgi:hypothetical protein
MHYIKTWMPGTRPGMTESLQLERKTLSGAHSDSAENAPPHGSISLFLMA